MTEAIDISGLNFQQLDELRHRVEHRVTRCAKPVLQPYEQWAERAAAIGLTIEEIIERGKSRRGAGRVRGGESD